MAMTEPDSNTRTYVPPPPSPFPPNSIHLVRTTQQITMQLSQMADQKASILMGATFVVFTVAIGQASQRGFSWPLTVLAVFAFISALLAVTAVLPRTSPAKVTGNRNLLFFGVFAQMGEDEFVAAVTERLRSDEAFIETMLRDVHQNGVTLARRKYHYLSLAYRAFIIGLCATVAVFLIEQAMRLSG